jgi:hypothetical protein
MFAWKICPALTCENIVVLKTAEQTPLSTIYTAKLLHEARLPPDVLNTISGYCPTAGEAMANLMDIDTIDAWFGLNLVVGSLGPNKLLDIYIYIVLLYISIYILFIYMSIYL